ncbi:MAG: hypothetical protein J5564_03760 [Clostridia bacterium]|nr:hypothetical protein [Clostridia bacterium]
MEIAWLERWDKKHGPDQDKQKKKKKKEEIANMDAEDYLILLEEIEHR